MKSIQLGSIPKWAKLLLFAATLLAGSVILIFFLTRIGMFGSIPESDELQTIQYQKPATILTADGKEMGTFGRENHSTVSLDEINPVMIDALLAIEDIRFHDHNGIDYRALGRVFIKTIILQQDAGGGSTLTQQLAKNLYPRSHRGGLFIITDKFREMIVARRIEQIYSKDEILELYLNTVSFGEDTYGIEMGAHRFFNKPPSDLDITESATLAGLLQATSIYNPYRNPDRSLARRNIVLHQMERYDFITEEEAADSFDQKLLVDYNRSSQHEISAPYFKNRVQKQVRQILENRPNFWQEQFNIIEDGLTIHTTLDSRVHQAAERAVEQRIRELQQILTGELERSPIFGDDDPEIIRVWKNSEQYRELKSEGYSDEDLNNIFHTPVNTRVFTMDGYEEVEISPHDEIRYYITFLNAGFIAMEPQSGNILAWVGGVDYRHFPFDQVLAHKQPGSAFKPILYASALENGRLPCDYQRNMLAEFADYDGWTPQNINEEYGGRYSLQAALAQSVNTVAVHLAMETGMANIQETAGRMGITSPVPQNPSIALGTSNLSLLELTASYGAFLNEGVPPEPRMVTKIYNSRGDLIYDYAETEEPDIGIEQDQLEESSPFLTAAETRETDETDQPEETELVTVSSTEKTGISPETAATMVKMLEKTVQDGTANPLRTQFGITHAVAGKTGTTQNFTDGWFVGFTPEIVFGARVGGWNNRVRFREFPAYASQTALPIAGHFLNNLNEEETFPNQLAEFHPYQTDTQLSMDCRDHRRDRFRDRVRDFFRGESSDEARVISRDENEEEESRNLFKRIGDKLGISGN